jgi:hypothetical protein
VKKGLFDAYSDRLGRRSASVYRDAVVLVWAEVLRLRRGFKADLRLFSGEIFNNVPLPAGSVVDGKGKGMFGGFRAGQRVLVGFVQGATANPVVLGSFPRAGQPSGVQDAQTFLTANQALDRDGDAEDFEIHHPSGFRVRFTDNALEVGPLAGPVLVRIDLASGRVETGDASIKTANGDSLKTYLADLRASIDALYSAIQNSGTAALDGGATYKAGLVSAVQSNPLPALPDDLLDTNLRVGPA